MSSIFDKFSIMMRRNSENKIKDEELNLENYNNSSLNQDILNSLLRIGIKTRN